MTYRELYEAARIEIRQRADKMAEQDAQIERLTREARESYALGRGDAARDAASVIRIHAKRLDAALLAGMLTAADLIECEFVVATASDSAKACTFPSCRCEWDKREEHCPRYGGATKGYEPPPGEYEGNFS